MSESSDEINKTLIDIFNNKEKFKKYTEFRLNKVYNIENMNIRNLLIKLNCKQDVKVYYNKSTKCFDFIGVLDDGDIRIIDFNDDMHDMMNKGMDFMISADNLSNYG